ncbi:alpha/beta fold hydrolase [Nonomuraea sp. NPDC049028]|uniref:alpha/beta fold hydrolase n=1 Tax=Nonomuraea sp. NPDC049028 TaxID=3364348 RepID=UPI00371AC25F
MSERGKALMEAATRQLREAMDLFGRMTEADLRKPCHDEGGDGAGDTVGAAGRHLADGYGRLGGLVRGAADGPAAHQAGQHDGSVTHGGGHDGAPGPANLADLLGDLTRANDQISRLGDLTDERLDSVLDPATSRFSDGRRTLEQVIGVALAHQAEHLSTLRRAVAAGQVEVPGARLYYETHGDGPLLVMVPGAGGTADVFRMVAAHLAAHHTVVIYDRRGFSRSRLAGPQDYDRRLQTDADDVRRLIGHLGGDDSATVFGASSGAIVGLETLARHPEAVRTLVPYEPPALGQLPDGKEWETFFSGVYDLYRSSGIEPALEAFRERTFAEIDRRTMARAPRNDANAAYWFEHELRQYPPAELDLDALTQHADRILPAAGRESHGYPCYEAIGRLGERLGLGVIELPGGHTGFLSHAAEFAEELTRHLTARNA